jgi:hypothetical protein
VTYVKPGVEITVKMYRRGEIDSYQVECAPLAGQVEAEELTGSAGLSKDEGHEQAAFPQR